MDTHQKTMALQHLIPSWVRVTTLIFLSVPSWAVENSTTEWVLMGRHGECVEIETVGKRDHELVETRDPHRYAETMRQHGDTVEVVAMPGTQGQAIEVRVPAKDRSLIFAKREFCRAAASR